MYRIVDRDSQLLSTVVLQYLMIIAWLLVPAIIRLTVRSCHYNDR